MLICGNPFPAFTVPTGKNAFPNACKNFAQPTLACLHNFCAGIELFFRKNDKKTR